jgi:hypothetical protein
VEVRCNQKNESDFIQIMIHSFELPLGVAIGGYQSVFPNQSYIRIGDSGDEIKRYDSINKTLDAEFTFERYPGRKVSLKLENSTGTIVDNYDNTNHVFNLYNCQWRFFDDSPYFKYEDIRKPKDIKINPDGSIKKINPNKISRT